MAERKGPKGSGEAIGVYEPTAKRGVTAVAGIVGSTAGMIGRYWNRRSKTIPGPKESRIGGTKVTLRRRGHPHSVHTNLVLSANPVGSHRLGIHDITRHSVSVRYLTLIPRAITVHCSRKTTGLPFSGNDRVAG